MNSKTLKRLTLASKILLPIVIVLCGVMVVAEPIMFSYTNIINTALGVETSSGGSGPLTEETTYFDTKYEKIEDVHKDSKDIIERTMAEGAVLLKNENNALPLKNKDTVNLYGLGSYFSVHVGQGSGGIEASGGESFSDSNALKDRVTLEQGFTAAGLTVNKTLNTWYSQQNMAEYMGDATFMGSSKINSQYIVKDIPWTTLPDAKNNSATAGVMVLSRNSGEGTDQYMDTTMDDGVTRVIVNQYADVGETDKSVGDALALTDNEKTVLKGMKALKDSGTLKKIIVIMNSASPLMCDFLENADYGIDACTWVGTLGTTGANAIGKLFTGEYNFSGRASDTFWTNSKYNPVYYNFGGIKYSGDLSGFNKKYPTTLDNKIDSEYYAVYQEGIYNGYKYTETRYEDKILNQGNPGNYDYSKVVSYPFGYGLGYADFTYSDMKVTENAEDGTYTVSVKVSNNTAIAGKEAVQIYLQKPLTEKDKTNSIEKASVELVGFTKVDVPANGEATATVTVDEKYFTAYDAYGEKTYVIGSENPDDKYLLTAAKDAHDAVNNILQYKKDVNGLTFDDSELFVNVGRDKGNKDLVWGKHIAYDAVKYSTNEFIKSENAAFANLDHYEGQQANYGVDKITNQFDNTDFKIAGIFSKAEEAQKYMTRTDWAGTYGKRITLTATEALKDALVAPAAVKDSVAYPAYGKKSDVTDEQGNTSTLKLIHLREKDYNDPLWDKLLDSVTYEETAAFLQSGLRYTNAIPSIAAPSTSQQNGGLAPNHSRTFVQLPNQSAFHGFAEELDKDNMGSLPPVFCCNGTVAATMNIELINELGRQTGEEAAWAGYNGIYGLGVNIHRGAYNGRQFEYYSEDGFLTGVAAGYEAAGLHELGVFVIMKHAVLNDQETHRAGINVWANEQSLREIYCRAMEIAIEIDTELTPNSVLGVMTGMNRLGAVWTGGQGFCNTVLRAEFGMRGFAISDYVRPYMGTVPGILNGNDLPDGEPAGQNRGKDCDGNSNKLENYAEGYGKLAWSMRDATKKILYTVVNSNAMNGFSTASEVSAVTPVWQIAVPVVTRISIALLVLVSVGYALLWTVNFMADRRSEKKETEE